MTRAEAIRLATKWAEGHVCSLREGEAQEYHKLCLTALREQEQREQGCEYCREDSEGYRKMLGSFFISNPFHKGEYYLNGGKLKPRKINFCPVCGRRLED